jgi:SAM-dependent methyltransferase
MEAPHVTSLSDQGTRSVSSTIVGRSPMELLSGAPDAANRMYEMIVGYWMSQIAGSVARMRIPDRLAGGGQTAAQLATELDCAPDAMFRLLRAASTAGILEARDDGTFALTPVGSTLRSDIPGSLRGLAATLTSPCHWLPWGRLDDAIRTGTCPAPAALGNQFFGYLSEHADELFEFTEAMEELSSLISTQVAGLLDLAGAKEVVDVGGGSGTLMAALLEANPAIHGTIVERPEMIPIARGLLSARGVDSRCDVVEGDFFRAVPPADVYILKLITHDWDDDHAAAILRNCAGSLRPDGKVVVIDALVPEHGSQPLPVLLDLHMHAVLGGRERTADEFRKLLRGAGLSLDRIIETRSHAQLLEARAATAEYR